jgi:hypothetical protein
MRCVSSIRAEIEDDDESARDVREHVPTHRRELLSVVSESVPAVVRAFADDATVERTWSRLRRVERRVPAGRVHAAAMAATEALCGAPLSELEEFGRSRYPFERFPPGHRCLGCDEAAGWPRS